MSAIQLRGVCKTYRAGGREVPALRGVDLAVEQGTLTMVRGRSGAGKSTLLSLLAGLDATDDGEIEVAGQQVSSAGEDELVRLRRESVSVIYQDFALIPLLTAGENVGVPLRIAKAPARERDARVAELLERVGLAAHAKQRPGELSGGQLQRVAIARALATRPQVLLADEPTGQLDSHTARSMMDLLREVVDHDGVTILMATHDEMLEQHADAVFELTDGTITEASANRPARLGAPR